MERCEVGQVGREVVEAVCKGIVHPSATIVKRFVLTCAGGRGVPWTLWSVRREMDT